MNPNAENRRCALLLGSQDLNSSPQLKVPALNYCSSNFLFWELQTLMGVERLVLYTLHCHKMEGILKFEGSASSPSAPLLTLAQDWRNDWLPGESGTGLSVQGSTPPGPSFSELGSLRGLFLSCPSWGQHGYYAGAHRLSSILAANWWGIKKIDLSKAVFSNQHDYWHCDFHVLKTYFHFSTGSKLGRKRKGPKI